MQNARDKPKKQRGRRPRKSKGDSADPATPAPTTPTQPPTPASVGDAPQPPTPNKDTEFDAKIKTQLPASATLQMQGAMKSVQNQSNQPAHYAGQAVGVSNQITMYANVHQDQMKPLTTNERLVGQASYVSSQASVDQRIPAVSRPDWQQAQLHNIQQQQQQQNHSQQQQQPAAKSFAQASVQNQRPQLSRVGISEVGLPLRDVHQEVELKSKVGSKMPLTPGSQIPHTGIQGLQTVAVEPWKNAQSSQVSSEKTDGLNQRILQPPVNSSSSLYFQNTSASVRISNDVDYFSQPQRQTLTQPPVQQLQSPTFIHNQSTMSNIISTHFNVTTTKVTQPSTAVIDNNLQLVSTQSTTPQLSSGSLHQQPWAQTTSMSSGQKQQVPDAFPQAQQMPPTELQRQASAIYPPIADRPDDLGHAPQPYSQLQSRPALQNDSQIPQNSTVRSPLHYPPGYIQQQMQQQQLQHHQLQQQPPQQQVHPQPVSSVPYPMDQSISHYNAAGEPSAKESPKAVTKKKKSVQGAQVPSGNVDFSLLNPEEQKKFLLERKKEDFERRRRLLEEQRQLRLKDQENQRTVPKKMDKKMPRTKQQRKVKGGTSKEREPMPKSPVRLILEDKGLRLPLCEPEVRLLYPLVQPFGSGYLNGDKMLLGSFGNATVQDQFDYYAQFPSPNPPVTSSNPPTPPASLPPSPGTINQSLRDSLQMIPTEGIFDDIMQKSDPNKNALLFRQDDRQQDSLGATYSNSNQQNRCEDRTREDSKEGVLVTLTMSGNDHRTPNERVSVVTDILGVNKPQTMEIVDEKPGNCAEPAAESLHRMPSATSIGNENDVHFSCLDNGKFKDNEGNKAPFCKHCDISIQGSGYIQRKDSDMLGKDSTCVSVDDTNFVKVNITSGDDLSFVFCSQMCLKSYYSLKSRMTSGPGEGLYADDSGQFIDPVRSVIPVSTGEASNSGYHGSAISTMEMRGEIEAAAPASVLVKRKNLIAEQEVSPDPEYLF